MAGQQADSYRTLIGHKLVGLGSRQHYLADSPPHSTRASESGWKTISLLFNGLEISL